jgi:hypothetical protein
MYAQNEAQSMYAQNEAQSRLAHIVILDCCAQVLKASWVICFQANKMIMIWPTWKQSSTTQPQDSHPGVTGSW